MSKADILQPVPRLKADERREIFELICEIEERALLTGEPPSRDERELLDRELADYQSSPNAGGTWPEVEARLKQSGRS